MDKVIIYTDGGSRGNPGLGAWAFAAYESEERIPSDPITFMYDHKECTTNNDMELTAVLKAITWACSKASDSIIFDIEIRSDSTYVINTLTEWCWKWELDGSIESRPNKDLIRDIMHMMNEFVKDGAEINFTKVKGHSGEPGNEFVDHLLNACMDEWKPAIKKSELPEVRWMRVERNHKDKYTYEIEYDYQHTNTINYYTGDVIAVMTLHESTVIIQAFDPDWFYAMYGIKANTLPVFLI